MPSEEGSKDMEIVRNLFVVGAQEYKLWQYLVSVSISVYYNGRLRAQGELGLKDLQV